MYSVFTWRAGRWCPWHGAAGQPVWRSAADAGRWPDPEGPHSARPSGSLATPSGDTRRVNGTVEAMSTVSLCFRSPPGYSAWWRKVRCRVWEPDSRWLSWTTGCSWRPQAPPPSQCPGCIRACSGDARSDLHREHRGVIISRVLLCLHREGLPLPFNYDALDPRLKTFVRDQEDGVFIQSLHPVESHLVAKLLDDVQSNLKETFLCSQFSNAAVVLTYECSTCFLCCITSTLGSDRRAGCLFLESIISLLCACMCVCITHRARLDF